MIPTDSHVLVLSTPQEINEVLDRILEIWVILRTRIMFLRIVQDIELLGAKLKLQSSFPNPPDKLNGCHNIQKLIGWVVVIVIEWCSSSGAIWGVVKAQ